MQQNPKIISVIVLGLLISLVLKTISFISPKNTEMKVPYDHYRPHYHFSPPKNWINDPNGLVFDPSTKIYHMYYQYNPFSVECDHKNWGHAISFDLMNWEVQTENNGVALVEDLANKTEIFSGSAVSFMNWEGKRQFVGIYTTHHTLTGVEEQSVAFSTSETANTLQKYTKKDPVILPLPGINDFRDPFVSFHRSEGGSNFWLMVVALPFKHSVRFYATTDFLNWNYLNDIDFGNVGETNGIWECPSIQKVVVKKNSEENPETKTKKYVFVVSFGQIPSRGDGVQYFVGDFDISKGFRIEQDQAKKTQLLDYGYDFYATTMWNFDSPDIFPEARESILTMSWMNNWYYAMSKNFPTNNFRGAMTIPRDLYLIENSKEIISQFDEGEVAQYEMIQQPVDSIYDLRILETSIKHENIALKSKDLIPINLKNLQDQRRLDIEINFQFGEKALEENLDFGLEILANPKRSEKSILGMKIFGNSTSESQIFLDRSNSGKKDFDENFSKFSRPTAPLSWPRHSSMTKNIKLRILVDVSSIEVFEYTFIGKDKHLPKHAVQSRTLTNLVFPQDPQSLGLNLFSNSGKVFIKEITIFELKSTIPN